MAPSLGSGLQVSGLSGSSSRAMASNGLAGFGDTPSSHHCPPTLGLRSGFRLPSLGKCQTQRGSRNLDNYGCYYYFLSLNRGQITHLNTTTSAGHRRKGPLMGGGDLGEHMEERGPFETSLAHALVTVWQVWVTSRSHSAGGLRGLRDRLWSYTGGRASTLAQLVTVDG